MFLFPPLLTFFPHFPSVVSSETGQRGGANLQLNASSLLSPGPSPVATPFKALPKEAAEANQPLSNR